MLVRDTVYKYVTKAEEKIFWKPWLTYLWTKFATNIQDKTTEDIELNEELVALIKANVFQVEDNSDITTKLSLVRWSLLGAKWETNRESTKGV